MLVVFAVVLVVVLVVVNAVVELPGVGWFSWIIVFHAVVLVIRFSRKKFIGLQSTVTVSRRGLTTLVIKPI